MSIWLALAAAVAQPAPVVKASDRTEQFQGDGGRLVLDPACRDFTVESVKTNVECAERLRKGETGTALTIASNTLVSAPKDAAQAIAVLENAIAAENHPAAHYLMGVFLGTGQAVVPRYRDAVKHLETAARRGNPAAADLWATLIVEGKGTDRNLPKAIELYEQAMAGGFTSAAIKLASLYLNGRYMPIDKQRGIEILKAAAAVGDTQASQFLNLSSSKIHNYQLFPSPIPTKVKVMEFGVFDNPEIPPNFGFDEEFQRTHYIPFNDERFLKELENSYKTKPTPYIYELAKRVAPTDPERAVRLYILGRIRMVYDTQRCLDPAAQEAVLAWDRLFVRDIRFALASLTWAERTKQARLALDEEKILPGDQEPWWVCRSGMTEMSAAVANKVGEIRLKPKAEWPDIRTKARAAVEAAMSKAQ